MQMQMTTSMIRTKLSSLDLYIQTIDCNVTGFNEYVNVLVETLRHRGEQPTDLPTNLWRAYASCRNVTFTDYIGRMQEEHDAGKEFTPDDGEIKT